MTPNKTNVLIIKKVNIIIIAIMDDIINLLLITFIFSFIIYKYKQRGLDVYLYKK